MANRSLRAGIFCQDSGLPLWTPEVTLEVQGRGVVERGVGEAVGHSAALITLRVRVAGGMYAGMSLFYASVLSLGICVQIG